jgi:hypothetical protein
MTSASFAGDRHPESFWRVPSQSSEAANASFRERQHADEHLVSNHALRAENEEGIHDGGHGATYFE